MCSLVRRLCGPVFGFDDRGKGPTAKWAVGDDRRLFVGRLRTPSRLIPLGRRLPGGELRSPGACVRPERAEAVGWARDASLRGAPFDPAPRRSQSGREGEKKSAPPPAGRGRPAFRLLSADAWFARSDSCRDQQKTGKTRAALSRRPQRERPSLGPRRCTW